VTDEGTDVGQTIAYSALSIKIVTLLIDPDVSGQLSKFIRAFKSSNNYWGFWTLHCLDKIQLMWFGSKLAHLELIHDFSVRLNERSLEQKRIKFARALYARHNAAKTFNAKADHLCMILFASVNSATLFSAKVNHLIKCAFYKNTPLKRPKQEYLSLIVCRVAILL